MIAGFFVYIKTPFYAPNCNKKDANSVRTKWENATHRIAYN
ncbi:MAG: hypothetical protein JWQ57_1949 [Mucilaginibacter sp.]|nr:hypothetical protein [Mucilaginibacter sp.]